MQPGKAEGQGLWSRIETGVGIPLALVLVQSSANSQRLGKGMMIGREQPRLNPLGVKK